MFMSKAESSPKHSYIRMHVDGIVHFERKLTNLVARCYNFKWKGFDEFVDPIAI